MCQDKPTILLVEDDEADVFIMKKALKQAGILNALQVVTDGQMALDYLDGEGIYSDRVEFPLPFILFLDLKLPYVHGFEVLSWIRAQPSLNSIIVIVLTGSDQEKDQQRAYALGARSYLIKPPTAEKLLAIFESLKSYWLSLETPPVALAPQPGRN
jgi:CheY-like chemotaxis protein